MRVALAILALLFVSSTAFAQRVVVLVRHAERADAGMAVTADPDLSAAGRARAEALAAMLKDAGITAIYVTELKRTRQTAEPLAKSLAIEPTVIPAKDTAGLIARLKATDGAALVIGHSNTLPGIVKALGVDQPITIEDADYDQLLVVTRGATPALLKLRFP